jgi:hypothetical protein
MNGTCSRMLRLCLIASMTLVAVEAAQAQILKDDFESGTVDAQIPTTGPWRINDSAPVAENLTARYRTATPYPFASGNRYAQLTDPQAASGYGFRLLSTNIADTGGLVAQINDQVTTFSFDFYEPLPDSTTGTNPGMTIGYYYNQPTGTGVQPDLNSGGRIYYSALHNGLLSPGSLVAGSGAATAYEKEKVNTIFMVANDSAAAVENYRDSQTVDPGQADVWVSLAGTDPIFAFSVSNPNVGTPERVPGGVGFRAFTNDIEDFFIDNVLLVSGASFDRSTFNAPAGVLGDYNGNGTVDAADYVTWRENPATLSNDSTPASVGPEDYTYWVSRFGATSNGSGSGVAVGAANVPEPSLLVLTLPVVLVNLRRRIAP